MWINLDDQLRDRIREVLAAGPDVTLRQSFDALIAQFTLDADDHKFITAAQKKNSYGELEVDDSAVVSRGSDPGAYVMAWVWVYNDEADVEDEDDELELDDDEFEDEEDDEEDECLDATA